MRKKLEIVFDDKQRTEYLTGFHKRKVKAKEEAKTKKEQQIKNEQKEIKQHYRDITKQKILNSNLPNYLKEDYGVVKVETQKVDGSEVVVESIDLSNSHYTDLVKKDLTPVEEPKLSLKKALKTNPSRHKWAKDRKRRRKQSMMDRQKSSKKRTNSSRTK
ncbi:Zinc finger CCHC-type and RNA-binding motif-containing protein 1 [Cichlidogyrus casuarinus]|uniref:Nucleolar protein 12 n=1 Tax=Cichlidogyrus casuarinus TaxID=1844966 RepID=A0ABD2QDZ2_9PLAT